MYYFRIKALLSGLHIQQLLIQLSLIRGVLADDLSASLLPGSLIGDIDDVAAGRLQLVEDLVLSGLGQVSVEGLRIRSSLHDGSLLVLGQLVPGVVGDDSLHSAQSMAVEDQVVSDLGEGVGLVVCDGLLSAIDNAGLQCAVQLAEGNDGGVSAQALDHAVHDGVVGHTQLQALEISDAGNGLDSEEVTEALLAVEDTTNGQAQLLGLVQELRCQIAVGKVPEVCAVLKGEGDARPESYWFDSSLYYDKLIKEGLGTKALERVMRKLGQKKVASGKYQMVVDNMNSSRLLSPVIDALYGSSIQQKNSFLLDKIDQKVLGDKLTVIDDPHMVGTSGARYFDGEGVATKRMPVFENGILKTYYIDTYSANKMNMRQTIASPSILTMQMGNKDTDGLIASVDRGILVTGFNGGNSNSTTGDFSYGVEGFLIEKGKLTQPISEMNATGNMISLWSNLAEVGNDPRTFSSWRVPSLIFDGVDFSGL